MEKLKKVFALAAVASVAALGACATPYEPGIGGAGWDDDFGAWDTDDSGELGFNEFESGFEDEGVFDTWDADDSGFLEEDEWGTTGLGADFGFDDADLNDDNLIGEDEVEQGLFDTWDEDNDSLITDTEFGL